MLGLVSETSGDGLLLRGRLGVVAAMDLHVHLQLLLIGIKEAVRSREHPLVGDQLAGPFGGNRNNGTHEYRRSSRILYFCKIIVICLADPNCYFALFCFPRQQL